MMHKQEAMELCKKHLHRYVLVHTTDGRSYDGIVEHVDDEHVYLAVPVGEEAAMGGYGDGFGPAWGYPYAQWPWGANANAPAHWWGPNMPAPAPWGANANAPLHWDANMNAPVTYAAEANIGPTSVGPAQEAWPNETAASPATANVNVPGYGMEYRPDGFGYGFGSPGFGGFGYPGFGYGFGAPFYGAPFFGPRRRFRRVILPLAALTALSLLPYY